MAVSEKCSAGRLSVALYSPMVCAVKTRIPSTDARALHGFEGRSVRSTAVRRCSTAPASVGASWDRGFSGTVPELAVADEVTVLEGFDGSGVRSKVVPVA